MVLTVYQWTTAASSHTLPFKETEHLVEPHSGKKLLWTGVLSPIPRELPVLPLLVTFDPLGSLTLNCSWTKCCVSFGGECSLVYDFQKCTYGIKITQLCKGVQTCAYCSGRKFVRVLTQDSALLHGVIAYAITHYHAGWRLPAVMSSLISDGKDNN